MDGKINKFKRRPPHHLSGCLYSVCMYLSSINSSKHDLHAARAGTPAPSSQRGPLGTRCAAASPKGPRAEPKQHGARRPDTSTIKDGISPTVPRKENDEKLWRSKDKAKAKVKSQRQSLLSPTSNLRQFRISINNNDECCCCADADCAIQPRGQNAATSRL